MKLPAYVLRAIDRLEKNGFEAYVVGGAVRDELLGRRPHDYDICTDALVEQMTEIFSDFTLVKSGARFGTLRVIINSNSLEITTYRSDGDYLDHRRPGSVEFGKSLKEDLARRDFTINAIAYNPKTGYVDYNNGQADLQSRVVRCVGEPSKRFSEDALRILRAVRFAAKLEFTVDARTEIAALDNKELLKNLSAERVRDELSGFIVCKNAGVLLLRYRELFFQIIPELAPCDGFDQHNPNHNHDVLGHIAETVNRIGPELVLRLAALLHDIGKPPCFTMDNGRGRFFGHMEVSAEMARGIMTRLHYSAKLIDTVCILVENHDKPYYNTPQSARRWLNRMGSKNVLYLVKLKKADCLAHDPSYHNRLYRIASFRRAVTEALQRNDCYSLSRLAVGGRDINSALGLEPGRYTGEILEHLLNLIIEGEADNNKQELMALAKEYNEKEGKK